MQFKEVKIEIFVPEEYVVKIREELNKINSITIGNYDNVMSLTNVRGYWRPLENAQPFEGEIGTICEGHECKIELRCKAEKVREALKVIRKIHPYEEPVINVLPIINELFE